MIGTGFHVHGRAHVVGGFRVKLGVAAALVVLGDQLFFVHERWGGAIGYLALAMLAAVVATRPSLRRDGRSWLAVAAAALFGFALIYDTGLLAWCLFWAATVMAVLLPATARFDDGWRWFQRLLLHGLRMPFAPLIDLVRLSRLSPRHPSRRFGLRASLPVIALPIVGSAIILMLFASANPVLARLLAAIFHIDFSRISIGRGMLWMLLFIASWGLLHPRPTQTLLPTFDGSGDLPLPGVSVASVCLSLIAFNLLFAMQNLMDIAYLGGFVPMPQGLTMTDYVHRGAYPLIGTALLAAAFVLVTLRPGSTTASVPAIRMMVVLWIVQNMVLVGSSAWRTLDYIETSMLTSWRIAALIWMALVALGLALICWRMLAGKSAGWLINTNLGATALVLTACCFVDLGSIAAWWNVRHISGVASERPAIDLCYLNALGGASLLPLIALEQRTDLNPGFRERVQSVRMVVHQQLRRDVGNGGWTLAGGHRLAKAGQLLARMKPAHMHPGPRNCDGSIPEPPMPESPAADVSAGTPSPPPAIANVDALPPGLPKIAPSPAPASPAPALTAEKRP